jgi:outer membrane murein-binding lipoprotein Lpp
MQFTARRNFNGATPAICLGFILASGCGASARVDKQLADMREEMIKVHNDQDRLEDRLSALESQQQAAQARAQAARPDPERVEHAPLKVVHLVPDSEGSSGDTSSAEVPAPPASGSAASNGQNDVRPTIKGSGDNVYSTAGGASPPPSKPPSKGTAK